MRPLSLVLAVLVAALGLAACDSGDRGEAEPPPLPPPAITRAELDEHLEALQRIADRNDGNRAAGTRGYAESAEYVAARLRRARWRVRFQRVRFAHFEVSDATLRVGGRRLRRARDFEVLSYSGSGTAEGSLTVAEDGCQASDLARLTPGNVALVGRGGCYFRVKALNAQRAGASAVVVVEYGGSRRGLPNGTLGRPGIRIPVLIAAARALGEVPDGVPARVSVDGLSEFRSTRNVLAETPGGRRGEIVMAGAHLDSVAGGPGLNDNGSGVAALIEAAEAVGPRPRGARVRLGFWGAEELGLLGSRRYVRSLGRAERSRIRAYLNLDILGSPNAVPALYADGDRRIARALRRAWRGRLATVRAGGGSDHAPFEAAGIPVNGLYTGATERGPGGRPRDPCYHLACDTLRNVDRAVLLQMARAAARALGRYAK